MNVLIETIGLLMAAFIALVAGSFIYNMGLDKTKDHKTLRTTAFIVLSAVNLILGMLIGYGTEILVYSRSEKISAVMLIFGASFLICVWISRLVWIETFHKLVFERTLSEATNNSAVTEYRIPDASQYDMIVET